jgi:hypothetical protein
MFLIFSIPGREARRQVGDGRTGKTQPRRILCMELSDTGLFVA